MYLHEPRSKRKSVIHVLDYWKAQRYRFLDLAKLARNILCVPVSTVVSKSAFSLGDRILDQFHSSLSPLIVEALVCTKDWLFGEKGKISKLIFSNIYVFSLVFYTHFNFLLLLLQ